MIYDAAGSYGQAILRSFYFMFASDAITPFRANAC